MGCPPYAFPIFNLALVPVHGLPRLFCNPALWLFSKPLFRTVAQLCQYLCVSVSNLSLPVVLLRSLSGSSMEVVFPTVYGLSSCDTRALHGLPILFIHFKPAFSKPLFSPVVPCNRGTCVHVCHSSFAFLLVLEFTPFPFSLSHLTHDWTQGENSDRL